MFKSELIDARALAEFLRLPASSLERVASGKLMIEKVNTKVVDRDNMLMLHFEGVAIVVLIATYIRLTYLIQIGTDLPHLVPLVVLMSMAQAPLLALLQRSRRRARCTGWAFWSLGQPTRGIRSTCAGPRGAESVPEKVSPPCTLAGRPDGPCTIACSRVGTNGEQAQNTIEERFGASGGQNGPRALSILENRARELRRLLLPRFCRTARAPSPSEET